MNLSDPKFAFIDVTVFNRAEGLRGTRSIPCLPPQLTLQDEIDSFGRDRFDAELRNYVSDMPPAYTEHVVVQKSRPNIAIPLALYIDGVQYATRNSLIGVWLVNLVTQRRHLMVNIRKDSLCRCGCKGWCTLWAIMSFVSWCIKVLSLGVHASTRADGVAFENAERNLRERANTPCPVGAIVFLKVDLAEFGATLGFWTTASNRYPCFLCNATRDRMIDFERWDAITHPFVERTWGRVPS